MKTKLVSFLSTLLVGIALSSCTSATTAGAKPYPLNTCIVSGNKLGSMGTPITKVHQGQEVKFCCEPCVKKFDANPGKYISQISQ